MKIGIKSDGMVRSWRRYAIALASLLLLSPSVAGAESIARHWNDELLDAIRGDFARPTVHARNLFHVSAAMWDAWAAYDRYANTYLHHEKALQVGRGRPPAPLPGVDTARAETISYARLSSYADSLNPTWPRRSAVQSSMAGRLIEGSAFPLGASCDGTLRWNFAGNVVRILAGNCTIGGPANAQDTAGRSQAIGWRGLVKMFVLLLGLLAAALLPAQTRYRAPSPPQPPVTAEEIAAGKRLYQGHCGGCHGPQGGGARGPNLVRPKLSRAPDSQSLFAVITRGIPGTEMPSSRQLHGLEVWKIVAFVESLGQIEQAPLPGDPKSGEDIYYGSGNCSACHWLNGDGARHGPELSGIGLRRSVDYLREALLDPAATFPDRYLLLSVVVKDGRRVRGIRLNEDAFTIQLRDFSEKLHSFLKEDLVELNRLKGESSMPGYKETLTKAQIDDVVSFMASQQGGS